MEPHDPTPRPRTGSAAKMELDGSWTLYGDESWTEVPDHPVVLMLPAGSSEEEYLDPDDAE